MLTISSRAKCEWRVILGNRYNEMLFNCWNTLKSVAPQHGDEKCPSVMVMKIEKSNRMTHDASLNVGF